MSHWPVIRWFGIMEECLVIEVEEGEIFDEATPEDIEAIIGSDFADSEKSPTWSTTAPVWSPSRRPVLTEGAGPGPELKGLPYPGLTRG